MYTVSYYYNFYSFNEIVFMPFMVGADNIRYFLLQFAYDSNVILTLPHTYANY